MGTVYSVAQVNAYIKKLFMRDYALSNLCIRGELSNCKYHSTGHIYFTLKDAEAEISCVMFAARRAELSFRLQDGQQVDVTGRIDVYAKKGSYQLYAERCALSGRGELYERYLRKKQELEEMGMFDPLYKKPIPHYAKRIGIVTAPTGAAIQDICNISYRKNPYAELILYPALVQGVNAKESIARGIETLDRMGLDVIIVGRGGGSIEDLWAFNEEIVARAIFDADTPIISAVGHETDFTIADFVADHRAPTPSAAAELANFSYEEFEEMCGAYRSALFVEVSHKLQIAQSALKERKLKLEKHRPDQVLAGFRAALSHRRELMQKNMESRVENAKFKNDTLRFNLNQSMAAKRQQTRDALRFRAGRLDALSPLKRISGGYGYVTHADGSAVLSAGEICAGERITTYMRDGSFRSVAEGAEPRNE